MKGILVRLGLYGIRVLVGLKSAGRSLWRMAQRPLLFVWHFSLPRIIIPVYHALYTLRRRFSHWYRPAKNKLMYLVANRHMLHVVAVSVAVIAGIANMQLADVRAETYRERTLMYGLVTNNAEQLIDEYADIDAVVQSTPVKYLSNGVLYAPPAAEGSNSESASSATVVGGSLSSLAISQSGVSVAPRDAIETYVVAEGDTLSTIASSYGVSLSTLLWANNLTVRSLVKPGQSLKILPVSGVVHTVKNGDTVAGIAKKYSVSEEQILAYNNIDNAQGLQISAQIIVPGGEIKAPTPVSHRSAVGGIFSSTPSTSTPKLANGAKMVWPTDMSYIVRGLSWYHTGVDIDCNGHANGTSTNDNYAAADGIVQFAGVKRGYGNVVEINHGNGLVTRYGHHYSLYVKTGQQVSAGTPIGRCGSTGTSTGTHIHFEVIANGRFMNPLEYIR